MLTPKLDRYLPFLLSPKLLLLLLLPLPPLTNAKSVIEPCAAAKSCPSLLSYVLPWAPELSEIAFRFQVNISSLLGANSIDATKPPFPITHIFPRNTLVKVPVSCRCISGIRWAPVNYTVLASDISLEAISQGFGGLVSGEQIRTVNSKISRYIEGVKITVPLPCRCFGNTNNGVAAVYMSYVVKRGERLSSIATKYGTTVHQLEAVNGLPESRLHRRDVIAIPLPACSSASLEWENDALILANNSYALTANDCIKCSCGPNDLNLQCWSSGIGTSCSNLQCKGSKLFVGQVLETPSTIGCNLTQCVYHGHNGTKIFTSLAKKSYVQCSGQNHSNICRPRIISPISREPLTSSLNSSPPSPSSIDFGRSSRPGKQAAKHFSNHAFMSYPQANFKLHLITSIFTLLL